MERSGVQAAEPPSGEQPSPDEVRAGHLGFVAHEVRNPLSTALWTAELLARMTAAERGGARGEKLSAMCLRSIARVRMLIEDHFLSERLDIGGLPVRLEALELAELVQGILERRPPGSPAVGVDLDPRLAVEADRTLLERAVDGLIACAGDDRTPVTISARGVDGEIVLVVAGRAAEAAALEDPVKGAPSDPTGRALALPLARRVAAALGGALAAEEGGWRLTLPRARDLPARPAPSARP